MIKYLFCIFLLLPSIGLCGNIEIGGGVQYNHSYNTTAIFELDIASGPYDVFVQQESLIGGYGHVRQIEVGYTKDISDFSLRTAVGDYDLKYRYYNITGSWEHPINNNVSIDLNVQYQDAFRRSVKYRSWAYFSGLTLIVNDRINIRLQGQRQQGDSRSNQITLTTSYSF